VGGINSIQEKFLEKCVKIDNPKTISLAASHNTDPEMGLFRIFFDQFSFLASTLIIMLHLIFMMKSKTLPKVYQNFIKRNGPQKLDNVLGEISCG
jgi:hypothetical protein